MAIRDPATSGRRQPASAGSSGPWRGWEGRAWRSEPAAFGVFQAGSAARGRTGVPGSCGRVGCSGHHNPAPGSQHPGRLGRRKDLWRWLSKPKGFCFSLGSLGSVVFPWQGSPASGAERGLGCPLPRWSSLCRVRVGARFHSPGRVRRNQYYTSHLLVLPLLFYLFIHSLLFYFILIQGLVNTPCSQGYPGL